MMNTWREKYTNLCENALHSPAQSCINGVLVSQLKLDITPLIELDNGQSFKQSQVRPAENDSLISQECGDEKDMEPKLQPRACSKCDRHLRRRQAQRSFDHCDPRLASQRRESFQKVIAEEHIDSLYESIELYDGDKYLLPQDIKEIIIKNNNDGDNNSFVPKSNRSNSEPFVLSDPQKKLHHELLLLRMKRSHTIKNEYTNTEFLHENNNDNDSAGNYEFDDDEPIYEHTYEVLAEYAQNEKVIAPRETKSSGTYDNILDDDDDDDVEGVKNDDDEGIKEYMKGVKADLINVEKHSDEFVHYENTPSECFHNEHISHDDQVISSPQRRKRPVPAPRKKSSITQDINNEVSLESHIYAKPVKPIPPERKVSSDTNHLMPGRPRACSDVSDVSDVIEFNDPLVGQYYEKIDSPMKVMDDSSVVNDELSGGNFFGETNEALNKRNEANSRISETRNGYRDDNVENIYVEIKPVNNVEERRRLFRTETWNLKCQDIFKERHTYEDAQPQWKSYLYQVQSAAPQPQRVICSQNFPDKPPYYGKEKKELHKTLTSNIRYHGPIPRKEAEQLVMKAEGCYLTRERTTEPGTYALTFRFNNERRNYRLYYDQQEGMHFVGEKRFETIHDLVADGLITLYVDYNAKDYIESMTLSVPKQTDSQKSMNKKDEEDNAVEETPHSPVKPLQNTFKASECAKAHNFKTQTYYGPHWCHYCRNFMWGLKAQGVRCQDCSYDCHKQCSDLVENNCSPDKKLVKRVFGVDLTTLIKAHDLRRPAVVDTCVKEIESRGLGIEGLYRVPGFADDITHLQNVIDKDGVVPDISTASYDDINVICGVLKLYFRMLPIPVITFELYEKFIDAVKLEERNECVKALCSNIKLLPPAHYETLKYFCRHLQSLQNYKDKNLMSSENLGIVFGPTLMRAPDHMAMQAIGFIQYQKKIVQLLIEEQDILFEK